MIRNKKKNAIPNHNHKTLSYQIKQSYYSLTITIVILNIILGALLLYIGSISNSKGYLLRQLQDEKQSLESDSRHLDASITEAKSLNSITQDSNSDKMTIIEEITFIDKNTTIVKRIEE